MPAHARHHGKGYHARFYAILCGMNRARLSTTVDATSLERARELLPGSDSRLLDRALAVLIEDLEGERERAALAELPYDNDPDLAWEAPQGPDLQYDGDVPEDVVQLAKRRRRQQA